MSSRTPLPVPPRRPGRRRTSIRQIAAVSCAGRAGLLILGGAPSAPTLLADAHRIAAATGAKLTAAQFNTRIERGRGRYADRPLPYAIDQAMAHDGRHAARHPRRAKDPVAFFAYPGKPGYLAPDDADLHVLARPEQDAADALARLADELGAPDVPRRSTGAPSCRRKGESRRRPSRRRWPRCCRRTPSSSTRRSLRPHFFRPSAAAPHDWLQITGGAIGCGLPLATGAAVGAPGRRVVALQADGSAMYTLQALWTQAREKLDVTTVLLSNRNYRDPARRARQCRRQSRDASRSTCWTSAIPISTGSASPRLRRRGRPRHHGNDSPTCSPMPTARGPFLIELMT